MMNVCALCLKAFLSLSYLAVCRGDDFSSACLVSDFHVWIVAGERLSATSGNLTKKGPHVTPPFLWSTEYRAKNHSLEWMFRHGLTSISGEVQCKRCDGMTTVEVNLQVFIPHFFNCIFSRFFCLVTLVTNFFVVASLFWKI